jgi:integrase
MSTGRSIGRFDQPESCVMASVFKTCECPNKSRCPHAWTVRYRPPGGRAVDPIHQSFTTKKEADAFAAKIEGDKVSGNYLDPRRGEIQFADYVEEWMAVQVLRPGTIDQYTRNLRNHTLPTFNSMPLSAITRPMVQSWVKRLIVAGLAPRTVHNIYGVFAGIMRAAVLDGRLARTPCVAIRLPEFLDTIVRVLNAEQVFALADCMRPQYRFTVVFAYGTGTRQGETFAASRSRIDRAERLYTVDRQIVLINQNAAGFSARPVFGPPKTKAGYRTIPLAQFVLDGYDEHQKYMAPGQELLFIAPRTGEALNRSFYRESIWRPALKKAGLPLDTTFHDLRHSFASTALGAGVPVLEVSRWLGHASITETTDTYGHLLPEASQRTRDALDRAWSNTIELAQPRRPKPPADDDGEDGELPIAA